MPPAPPPTEPPVDPPEHRPPDRAACPPLSELEAVAGGASASAELSAHIARCRPCADHLDSARFGRRFAMVMGDSSANIEDETDRSATALPAVPGYRVVGELSRGGQGVVYRAEQIASGQSVAIKVLHPSAMLPGPSRVARARFLREIQIVASMHHSGIVGLLDSLTLVDGRDALIMEFVDGEPLDGWLGRSPAPSRQAVLSMLAAVAEALHHAHQKGVIHRDLKPSNVIVDREGRPRLLDFGVARRAEGSAPTDRITRTGEFTGTLAYAAPEQVTSDTAPPDVRTDVYALGVIGFQALTGRLPYPVDGSLETTIRNIATAEPPNATQSGLDIDAWTVIAKAMAKEPARRYQSAADLARDFRAAAAGEAIDARRDSRWYVLRKSARRHRLAVAMAATVLVGLVSVLGVLAIGNARLSDALRESNLRQLHAHTAAGARARAEAILWPALDRSFRDPQRAEAAIWDAPLPQRELLWAFMEMQASAMCVRLVPPDGRIPVTVSPVEGGRFGVVYKDGTSAVIRIDAEGATSAPGVRMPEGGGTAWITPSGRHMVVVFPEEIRCIDAATGALVASTPIRAGTARLSGVVVSSWGIVVTNPEGELRAMRLPNLETVFETSGLPGEQRAWLDPKAERVAYFDADSVARIVDVRPGAVGESLGLRVPPLAWGVSYPQIVVDPGGRFVVAAHAGGLEVATIRGPGVDADPHRTPMARLLPRQGYRVRVAIDPEGSLIASSAFGDSTARMWRTDTWEALPGLPGHDGAVLTHSFSDDGSRMFTADAAGTLRLWATPGHAWRHRIGEPTSRTHDLAISPDGGTLFACDAGGVLRAFPLGSGSARAVGGGIRPGAEVMKVAVADTGGWIAAYGIQDQLELLGPDGDGVAGRTVRIPGGDGLASARFRPGTDRLCVVTQRGQVSLIDAPDASIVASRTLGPGVVVSSLRFGRDGAWISIARRDGQLELLDPDTLATVRTVRVSEQQLRSQAVSPDRRTVACVGDSGRLMLVDVPTGRVRSSEPISENSLFGVAFHPDGRTLVVGDRAGQVFVMDTGSLGCLATLDAGGSVMSLVFAPDGGSLFVAALDRPVERWDFASLAGTLRGVRPVR